MGACSKLWARAIGHLTVLQLQKMSALRFFSFCLLYSCISLTQCLFCISLVCSLRFVENIFSGVPYTRSFGSGCWVLRVSEMPRPSGSHSFLKSTAENNLWTISSIGPHTRVGDEPLLPSKPWLTRTLRGCSSLRNVLGTSSPASSQCCSDCCVDDVYRALVSHEMPTSPCSLVRVELIIFGKQSSQQNFVSAVVALISFAGESKIKSEWK